MPSSTPSQTSSRSSVRARGATLFLLCGLLSFVAFISGMIVFGKDDVSYGCAVDAPTPPIGGPYDEDTRILDRNCPSAAHDRPRRRSGPWPVEPGQRVYQESRG